VLAVALHCTPGELRQLEPTMLATLIDVLGER